MRACVRACVCVFDALVNPAKSVKPIETLFKMWTRVGPFNSVFYGGRDPPTARGNFAGFRHIEKHHKA